MLCGVYMFSIQSVKINYNNVALKEEAVVGPQSLTVTAHMITNQCGLVKRGHATTICLVCILYLLRIQHQAMLRHRYKKGE